jgi:uncharacterized Zn finger protein
MAEQNKEPETTVIVINGDNQTLADVLNEQYGQLTLEEAKARLEKSSYDVWTDEELRKLFDVSHFSPPYANVVRKVDSQRGTVGVVH